MPFSPEKKREYMAAYRLTEKGREVERKAAKNYRKKNKEKVANYQKARERNYSNVWAKRKYGEFAEIQQLLIKLIGDKKYAA